MYKKIIVGFVLAGWAIPLQAQDVGTLLDQLAALRGYIVTTEDGYRLVEEGLHTIGDVRRDEFNLHTTYFTSLLVVNPAVKNSPLVSVVVQLETSMLDQFAAAMSRWRSSIWLQEREVKVVQEVYAGLVKVSTNDLRGLQSLLADSGYLLSDGERLRELEKIATRVKMKAEGVTRYIHETDLLIAWRQQEKEQMNELVKWRGNW